MLKIFLKWLLTFLFKVDVKGIENYKKAGDRVLIIANHSSFLDPLLLGVFLPDKITFAINSNIAKLWWLKPFLGLSHVFPMDPTHPISLKNLIHFLQKPSKTVIFPEGRITVTGSLMKVYDGTGMVVDKSGATILPIRIEGAQYTHFSRLKNIVRLRYFPKITLQILPPTKISFANDLRGKARRHASGLILTDIMSDMMFSTSQYKQTLFSAMLDAKKVHGGKHKVAEDLDRIPISYNTLITRSLAIGNALTKITAKGENVGVYLPNSSKTLNVVLGLQIHQRVPAMLNYSTGAAGMISACHTAKIKTVLTSHRFIELGNFAEDAQILSETINLVYLEDLAKDIRTLNKLGALIQAKTAHLWYPRTQCTPESPAVVLFTSGSEGTPKGVVLSHRNILANHKQVSARISFNAQDTVLNFLPMFHSFGFTVGTMLPIMNGMTTFFYPSPLHYSIIPEMAYETNSTIIFGTNTFLAAYGKKAHAYDFFNMRYVVAGAEKLHENTRKLWSEKFGIRIMEGYGATETSPVAAVNTPMFYKAGTVGRLMPGMQYKLETVPGIENAGKLHLYGENIMQGYLLADKPGELVPPSSIYGPGWYDTGDIVHVDEENYVSIRGRSKRFAKIAGEMVSLTATEQLINDIWPDAQHVIVCIPDERKGEQLVLITTQIDATNKNLMAQAKGVASINLPKKFIIVESVPVLATGKINYIEATEQAIAHFA
ncbi:acyl-[acyl-carrier-protein]-phospholipid O-acyltransferase/long-chain-fatty-acid--[acyl-carrier-protein] ligase [Bathymodiolus platifrons methanotrophic gill symbiont]|uniref:AMP-binding protein n=1 Tax=Bathymodiolus platifrons methanotrophic gill symbiont TaxID=113268 RepID=UPI000B421ED5|nr:AMP-binding protein [Bathymodiolus platifrons methanotrophic gill symbiont]TXK94177.1 acyl-[ACP]--phospholipid O-acyltransferase [Methylococcaceae bacterium HT1]TXL16078.1 acyl-[ACP]--phospholipid O-acyltransferase [Methylococcaceae bacterium HT3]TXL21987.1 acyl-[ACP]--phospholipid O-acyltransferase [Methylococcaceae bacterium HT2]GAW86105.1 acyl-[acyl-carrier-protein]-phospholipid O-acyltransferase/long-chain-fatty-acid--[acyl-carrier-protein] ligase [Bathymodiolus platifrons methanotrophic